MADPRHPTDTLTAAEAARLRELVTLRGEKEAARAVGLRSAETLYRAIACIPIARLTAEVVRGRLDRI